MSVCLSGCRRRPSATAAAGPAGAAPHTWSVVQPRKRGSWVVGKQTFFSNGKVVLAIICKRHRRCVLRSEFIKLQVANVRASGGVPETLLVYPHSIVNTSLFFRGPAHRVRAFVCSSVLPESLGGPRGPCCSLRCLKPIGRR
jgi:hypothetical protein